jgi:hypothetical protein
MQSVFAFAAGQRCDSKAKLGKADRGQVKRLDVLRVYPCHHGRIAAEPQGL